MAYSMTHHLWAIVDPATLEVSLRVTEGSIPEYRRGERRGVWVYIKGFRLNRTKR